MNILIAGASGFIGSELVPFLRQKGHKVVSLVRDPLSQGPDAVWWDPQQGKVSLQDLEGFDAWINLAGENIASGRWTKEKKKRILESRTKSTALLAQSIPRLQKPPKIWINASAIGIYGDTGDGIVREGSQSGNGFLAEVTRAWETAAKATGYSDTRLVFLRTGVVLGARGGALKAMLWPFKLGLGGAIGSGKQYMSWISLDDYLGVVQFILENPIEGPVNVVAARAVTNYEFTKTLGKVLQRPTVLPLPSWLARLLLGESADELLLASTRVEPRRLLDAGYTFRHPDLESALRTTLQKN